MGGKSTSTTATKLDGISIQSSVLGLALPIGWGTGRVSCNLIWYGAFTAIPHTTTQKAGKGLGGSSKNTTYTYTASIILGLCEGTLAGVSTVYKDKAVYTGTDAMAQAGLSLAAGTLDQAPWAYLVSRFPDQALAYSGIAYAYASDYDLGDSAALPNHSFEAAFPIRMDGLPDADPRDIVIDFLTNVQHGIPGWGAGLIGDLSSFSAYARATGIVLSPVIDSQRQASDFLTEITDVVNSDPFWSEGVFKIVPRGDADASGNGVTWSPDLTPIYDLTEDDFSPADGDPPVVLAIQDQSDAYNMVQVEFLDRANQYNTAIQPSQDLDNIITYGRRKQDPTTWHSICDAGVAATAADLLCRRTLYLRRQFTFRLPWDFCLLEPTDKVTLTTATDGLRLDRQLVKLIEIAEDEDGLLTCTAEELLIGTATAAAYPGHTSAGYQPNADVAPGSVNVPVLFNAPTSLTGGAREVWCAAASLSPTWGGCEVWISADGTSYTMVGRIDAPGRYGTTAALPAHVDPDADDTLVVDLSASRGALLGGTQAEYDQAATLALLGGELIAYRDAALTGTSAYSLSPLRRGLFGTAPVDHATGERFVRLDDALFRFSYASLNVGATIHVKLPSFNIYGRAVEDLATVTAYTVDLTPATAMPDQVTALRLAQPWTGSTLQVVCDPADRATYYRFRFYAADETTLLREIVSSSPSAIYTSAVASQDGIRRTYAIEVMAGNDAGDASASAWLTVTNAAPAALASSAIDGGTTTATATATADADPDLAGYILFYSATSGFDPATTGGIVTSGVSSISVYGLAAGTYYGRLAAYDGWTSDPAMLNLSDEISFTIAAGGGSTPSGGGTSGGGYAGQGGTCPDEDERVLLANAGRTGPGDAIRAGDLVAGRHWVWTEHEMSGLWAAYPVIGAARFAAELWRADGFGRATPTHPVRINGCWVRMAAIGTPNGDGVAIRITIDDAHTFVTVQPCGAWVLNHNKAVSSGD